MNKPVITYHVITVFKGTKENLINQSVSVSLFV